MMFGTIAWIIAIAFTCLAACRMLFASDWVLAALMVSGLGGGAIAIANWAGGADSRWLVGGIMLVLAEIAALFAARVPALRIVTLVIAVLTVTLLTIAMVSVR